MSRREWVLVSGALAAAILGSALVVSSRQQAGPSALSRRPDGLLAARRVLEAGGASVTLLDREAVGLPDASVLLVAFPWRRGGSSLSSPVAREHLKRGGTLVLAYSPGRGLPGGGPAQGAESALLADLGVATRRLRGDPPLAPAAWRRFVDEEWTVAAARAGEGTPRTAAINAPSWVPVPPRGAVPLLVGPEETVVAFAFRQQRGTVAVVPAELLANRRLAEPASADLLETLRRSFGDAWFVDELHQGLVGAGVLAAAAIGPGFGLLVGQLALLYALAVVALGTRLGAPWRERPPAAGSSAGYLRGLGALHDRLGHHAAAARLLVSRAQELAPRLWPGEGVAVPAGRIDGRALVALGRAVAELQHPTARPAAPPAAAGAAAAGRGGPAERPAPGSGEPGDVREAGRPGEESRWRRRMAP